MGGSRRGRQRSKFEELLVLRDVTSSNDVVVGVLNHRRDLLSLYGITDRVYSLRVHIAKDGTY
jgi:hypothetical protein